MTAARDIPALETAPTAVADEAATRSPVVSNGVVSFQDAIARLDSYWAGQGCIIWLPHNVEVGAGTMNPATFLRVLGPEPWNVAYVEPSIRPDDARYGENPNRVGRHHQYQVILKPDPGDPQQLYLNSLAALGIDLSRHDIRFVEDNWESPALGAWGLGWEVWLNGLEITQFTYFQQSGSLNLDPVSVEITYGLDRILMALQNVGHFKDLRWNDRIDVGSLLLDYEVDTSRYYFESADVSRLESLYQLYESEAQAALDDGTVSVAYDYVLKCSHTFNLLDARGAVGVTERARFFKRMRRLAGAVAEAYIARREAEGFPLSGRDWVAGNPPRPASGTEVAAAGLVRPPTGADGAESGLEPTALGHTGVVSGSEPAESGAGSTHAGDQDLVLEVGTEELPVADVDAAVAGLAEALPGLLSDLRLGHGALTVHGTPRRITAMVREVATSQTDVEEHVVGPPARVAFDADGKPTKAAEGFARSVGVDAAALEIVNRGGEERVAALRRETGRPAAEVLAEPLAALIGGLPARRNMRWNGSGATFARPVRWIVALHGPTIVPIAFAGLEAGRETRGLRPAGSPSRAVQSATEYTHTLVDLGVTLSVEAREKMIAESVEALGREAGGVAAIEPALLREVANLVEQPFAILGRFEERFLTLPAEVLTTVMKKHQRYFPVRDTSGDLLPYFVTVANGRTVDAAAVRHGNEGVISARFADAAYFWDQDRRLHLEEYTPDLERLTFEARLGSMLDKVERLRRIVPDLAAALDLAASEREIADRATALAKSDLATSLVVELTSLQGTIGREYALASGEDPPVADAIFEQYLPRSAGDRLPATPAGTALALADRLDTLVSLFAVGVRPTGTQDPYGLRRAALGIVAIASELDTDFDLEAAVGIAADHLPDDVELEPDSRIDLLEFLRRRMEVQYREAGYPADVVAAVLAVNSGRPLQARAIVETLTRRVQGTGWTHALQAYARCARIVRGGDDPGHVDPEALEEPAARALWSELEQVRSRINTEDAEDVLDALAGLTPTINRFFDEVLVMDENPERRRNRLALVQVVAELPRHVADLSQLEGF